VAYTIIASKWGSPNDPQCVRQATAALEQVFPQAELPKFLSGSDDDKRRHLQEHSKLVLGVRVFQTFGGDMSDPATNMRHDVPKKLDALKSRISAAIEGLNSMILRYSEILKEADESPADQERQQLTRELVNRQQFLFFYELLLARLAETEKVLEKSCREFDSLIENMRNLMEFTDSVPTAKATPIFLALSSVWQCFQTCEDQVRNFELLLARLRKHRDTFTPSVNVRLESPRREEQPEVEIEGIKPESKIKKEEEISADDGRPVVVSRDREADFAFNGFCPVTLVKRDGLLLPGDVVVGSVKWERKYYAFVDQEARELFQADPAKWNNDAINVARKRPELVSLLGLHSEFPNLQAPRIPVKAKRPEPPNLKYRDLGTETVLHPIEFYIDRTYHWNEWELMKRKKILKGLENKRTTSAQTDISHYRRESGSQTFGRGEKNEQTKVDSGTAMPRTVRFLAGLRGDSQTSAKMVTLTLILGK
jgi:hypothetical protein